MAKIRMFLFSRLAKRHPGFRISRFVLKNSLLLLIGTTIAIVWANFDISSYELVANPLRFAVNDIGMVFFFALAAKEVREAMLPGGPLSSPHKALSPITAAVGGMLFPAAIYLFLTWVRGSEDLVRGWAIPCATDIAFSSMVARMIFPSRHPAIPFLLLLAIADDAIGLIILAAFYGSGAPSFSSLGLLMGAALALVIWMRRKQVQSFWPYVVAPGALSWVALYAGGFHPALALVPIVPFMPYSRPDLRLDRADTLHRFERWWATPVQFVLLFFGFANAGVRFEQIGAGTYYVLVGLLVGKPAGIMIFSWLARFAGGHLPPTLRSTDLLVIGIVAGIGFTVSLFFATAAFPHGPALAETKMGSLMSFLAAPLALVISRALKKTQHHTSR